MNFSFYSSRGKTHHVGQISVFMGLNRRSEEYVSTSICNSTTASMGALSGLHSPHWYLREHRENRVASRCALSWIIFFPKTLKLFEPLCPSLIRGYTDMRISLLCFVLFRENDPWHLAKVTWLGALRAAPPLPTKAFSQPMLPELRQISVTRGNGLRLRNTSHQHQHSPL